MLKKKSIYNINENSNLTIAVLKYTYYWFIDEFPSYLV